jgi:hypothetical protein
MVALGAVPRRSAYVDSAIARGLKFLNAWLVRMDTFLVMSVDRGTMTGRAVLPLLRATIDTVRALAPSARRRRSQRQRTGLRDRRWRHRVHAGTFTPR